ncbi:MAG: phage tail tape measure protein [Candidatus Promineofilum sp.]|nr:phage tail tape measure protein [Promineifilum sp.]
MEIAKLYITLAADASQYQGTLAQVDRDTTSWASGLADRMAKTLGVAILAAVAAMTIAIGGFFVSAVDKAADLEAQMDTVAALLGATAEQAELLRQATIDLALDPNLKVSATEAAQAIEMLAQNGLSVEEILGGAARATVLLANATGADFTTAARIATDAMALWGMEADQLGQVADGVTAVLVQSKFEVTDYALALAQAGGVAAAAGVSFEDFNATLVAIAPYFASGSDAGTSYKTMLQRLIPTTNTAKDAMSALGLITEEGGNAFFDSQGNMRDMAEVAGILHGALGGLTEQQRLQALSTIFGTDAMRAAVAMSQFTEEEFRRLQAVMANTSAAEIAAQRMQNFSGAMEIFKGVVEGLQLQLGNVLLPILTKLALEGANLLAAWGPALIAAFQNFFDNLSEGMSVIDAFIEAIWDIAPQPVLDALVAFRDNILPLIERVAQAIASFVSWKDAVLAFGLMALWAVGSVLLPMLAPIAGIVAAVAGLALVFGAVRTAWENDFLGIRTAVEGFVGVVQDAIGVVSAFVSGDMARAAELFERLPGPVQAVVAAVVGFIANIQTLVTYIRQVVADGNLLNDALGRLQGAWQPLGLAIGNVVLAVQTFVQALRDGASPLEALRAALPNLGEAARLAGQAVIDGLVGAFTSLGTSISTGLENLKTAIFNWAGTTSWLEVGQKILEGIASFFHNLGDKVAEIEAGLFNWIASAVDGIDWRTVGETIINGIVAAIGAVVGLLAAAGTAIVSFFGGFFTNEELGPAGQNIITALGNAISEFAGGIAAGLAGVQQAIFDWAGVEDWSGVAEKIAEMIGEKLGEAGSFISAELSEWQTAIFDWAGEEDWQGVAEHVAELIGEKLGEAGSFVSAELSEWQTAIFDWAGEEDWQGVAEHIAELVGEKLGEAGSFISAELSEWQTAIFDWAGVEDWQGVAEHVAELIGLKLGEAGSFVSAKLSEWQTAIFDWAGVEDWQGVAEKIAELVGAALGEAGSAVVARLSEWEQAVFDWADGADWGDVAETIAEKVGTWLGDVSDRVTAKLSAWITAITTWVGQQDWKQIGYDMMDRIITAFTEWKERIAGKLNGWLTDTKTETEGYAWWEVGAYILSKIAEGAIGLVSDWTQAIGAWVSNIGQAIAQNMGNLVQLGRDIVGGIVAGIGAAGGFIDGAMQRLAEDTEQAGRDAYQSESPARLMIPLGFDIPAGVAVGIIQGTGLVVDAIQEIAGSVETEGAKAFGEAMKVLAEGLAAGLNAILDLSAFPGVGGSFLDNLRTVVEMLGQMVAEVNRANVYGEEALKLLGTFVDVAGGIAELMLPLIVALTEIGRFQPPSPEAFTAAMAQLATYLSLTVGDIAAANQYSELVLEGLSAFLDVMGQIADTVGPFIAVLNDINAFGIVDLWFFHEGLAQLWYTMLMVVQKVQELATLGSETLGRMEGLLDVVGAIADLIGPFIESLYELNAFGSVHLDFFHEGLAQLAYVMLMVVGALNEANDWGSAALQAVQQFAETAGAIAEMIGPMIEGLLQINALDGTMNEVAYHAVYFRNGVRGLVDALASAAALFTTGTLQHVQEFAETAGAIAEIIVPAVEGLMVIGTLTGDLNYLGLQATYFRNGLRTVVDAIASAASLFTAALLNQTQLFAETAGKIMELIGPAIEGFGLIGTLTGEVNYLGLQAVYLRNGLRIVVDAIASAASLFTAALLNQTQLFADTAGAVVDLIADAIETLALLAGYVAAAGLEAAAAQFAADLVTVVTAIVNALQAGGLLASEALTAAGDLADGLSDVLGVVEDGVEALAALAGYVSVSGIGAKAQQFAIDLAAVIAAVVAGLQQAGILADAAIVAAGELADGLGDVLGMVEDGVDALTALAGYVTLSGIGATAQQFATDLAAVIAAVVNALVAAGVLANEAIVQAGELADGLADILGVVEDGVGAIAALSEYVATSGIQEKAAAFAADLAAVITAIVNGLVQAGLLANQAVAEAGELAGRLSDLLGVVADGIEAIRALAEYRGVEGLQEKVQRFTSDLVAVATTLATQLTAAANAIGTATIDAARAFATAVAALAGEVQTAVQGLGQLAGVATPDIDPILAYIVVSAQTIQQSFTAAGDIGQAVQYAANFRQNLEQLVQEVQAAVAQLNALAGVGTTGSIGAALAAIAASLQNTAGQFAGAGTVLANALIVALAGGINGGQGQVMGAASYILEATRAAGETAANRFISVGDAIIDAITSAVLSGQGQVVAAVVQVVGAAIAAGIDEARRAADMGRQVIQAALAEINAGRGQLDAAGAAAGEAMIDGMARAITNGRSRLVNAIIATVNAAVAAAKAALGIASPSRVAEALFGNFMATAELALSDPRGLVAAIGKSTRAMVTEAARAAGTLAQMVVPAVPMVAPVAGGAQSVRLTPPALGTGTSSAGAAMGPRAATAQAPVYNFYGDFVVEGVQDGPGLLEQLATLTAGARRR